MTSPPPGSRPLPPRRALVAAPLSPGAQGALAALVALAAVALPLWGCGDGAPQAPGFFEPAGSAQELPSALELVLADRAAGRRDPLATSVDLRKESLPEAFQVAGPGESAFPSAEGLELRLSPAARGSWKLEKPASELTHLLIELEETSDNLWKSVLEVLWRRTDETLWNAERLVTVAYASAKDGHLLVPLADHPGWKGDIAEIGFRFGPQGSFRLRSIETVSFPYHVSSREVDPGHFLATRAVIDRERREALLVATTSALEDRIPAPAGATLVAGCALHPLTGYFPTSATRFVLEASDGTRSISEELVLDPAGPGDAFRGWNDLTLPLAPLHSGAGGEILVTLRTEPLGEAASDQPTAFPLWTRPRVQGPRPAAAGPNLLVVSFDTLRPDHLESYGYGRRTSPTVTRLAREGVLFEHCRSHAPTTLSSHGSLFTGIPAIENRVYGASGARLPVGRTTLAETLRAAGFATAAFAGGAYFDPVFGLDRGFETYSYAKTDQARRVAFDYSDITLNTSRAIDWVERNHDRRFFLFFHTYEVHSPYAPHRPFFENFLSEGSQAPRGVTSMASNAHDEPLEAPDYEDLELYVKVAGKEERYSPSIVEGMIASYDSEIRVADHHLGRLLARMGELGVLDETLVVFTSDHGEAFLEHGRTGHGHLYENNLLVPLVMRYPAGLGPPRRIDTPVQLMDVMPTALELLGVPTPGDAQGSSLAALLSGGDAPPPRVAVSYDTKSGVSVLDPEGTKVTACVLAEHPLAGRVEAYDVAADPAERTDLWPSLDEERRRELSGLVFEALSRLPGTQVELQASEEVRVEATLRLSGSHASLRTQLRAFPLAPGWIEFEDGDTARIATAPLSRTRFHVHPGSGELWLGGELVDAAGTSTPFELAIDLEDVPLEPEEPLRRTVPLPDGGTVELTFRVVDPEGGLGGAAGEASAETLDQLKDLGYL